MKLRAELAVLDQLSIAMSVDAYEDVDDVDQTASSSSIAEGVDSQGAGSLIDDVHMDIHRTLNTLEMFEGLLEIFHPKLLAALCPVDNLVNDHIENRNRTFAEVRTEIKDSVIRTKLVTL